MTEPLFTEVTKQDLLAEVERLRRRIHEAVDECQRRHAKYVSRCAEFDTWSAWARSLFEKHGSDFWGMTSEANRLVIMSIIAERDAALAEVEQLRAEVMAPVRERGEIRDWLDYRGLPPSTSLKELIDHERANAALAAIFDAMRAGQLLPEGETLPEHDARIRAEVVREASNLDAEDDSNLVDPWPTPDSSTYVKAAEAYLKAKDRDAAALAATFDPEGWRRLVMEAAEQTPLRTIVEVVWADRLPTPYAYVAACRALERHRQRADEAEARVRAKVAEEASDLDAAMHSVWLHGNWRWLTGNMTTAEREAAADAVDRHTATFPPDDQGQPVPRWWREQEKSIGGSP